MVRLTYWPSPRSSWQATVGAGNGPLKLIWGIHKNGLIPSHSRFRTSPAIHQHFILAQKSKQLCGTIKVDIIGQSTIIMVSEKTGKLVHAVHVYLGHTSKHQEKHLNKNIIPIEKEYWIVTFPFEWQSKRCKTAKWKHGGASLPEKFLTTKFSP